MAGGGQAAPIFGWMARRVAFTMADRLSRFYTLVPSRFAFTMAEILLSLTIIGVVAAITLPSLMGNINERTWNTQRKALHARMSQAIAMMPQLNGYGTYVADTKNAAGSVTSSGTDTAAEAFLTEGLSKVLKINNICDNEHLEDCGIVKTFTNMVGNQITLSSAPKMSDLTTELDTHALDTKTAAFETQNGESLMVYYNPICRDVSSDIIGKQSSGFRPLEAMCVNFVYDLNGNKGPNTVGKDIGFMTALNNAGAVVVAPVPYGQDLTSVPTENVTSACRDVDEAMRMPNLDEVLSMIINNNLLGLPSMQYYTASQKFGSVYWHVSTEGTGGIGLAEIVYPNYTTSHRLRCVKR